MTRPNEIEPPRWPQKVLRYFIRRSYLEEIEGDMEEVFRDNLEHYPVSRAKRMYTWEMLRLLRPALLKNLEGFQNLYTYPMLKNYFKVSFRSLMKNPVSSVINLTGLTAAIAICILAYGFSQWVYGIDQFHQNKENVYLVTFLSDRDGSPRQNGNTPRPLGEMLRQDYSELERVCRLDDYNVVMKQEDNVFHEQVRLADPEFLEMFTFPMKWGTSASLSDLNSIILSEEMSLKYFGDENPIGSDVLVIFNEHRSKRFKVTGVSAAFPETSSIQFNFLINYENVRVADPDMNMNDWKAFTKATLVQVSDPSALARLQQGMGKYKKLQKEVQRDWAISSFVFEPLSTLYENGGSIDNDIAGNGYESNSKSVIFLAIISLFMLTLACFNYINIAIASVSRRFKEIGIRKAIGASKSKVVIQFLAENILLTFLALILGLGVAVFIFIPGFEYANNFSMDFDLMSPKLWIILPLFMIITGIASGIYPALYVSRFQVVSILKGSTVFGRQNIMSKFFLGLQLVIACIFITCAVMFTQNTTYLEKRSWGYNPFSTFYAKVDDQPSFERLKAVMERNPDVMSIAGSKDHLGINHESLLIRLNERQYEVNSLAVDANYLQTMGFTMNQGRFFYPKSAYDTKTAVINQSMALNLALTSPIGQIFELDSVKYEIIGVVDDFHSYNFSKKVAPTMMTLAAEEDYRYLVAHVREGSERKSYDALQREWIKLFPEIPFQGGYQEDVWGGYFGQIELHGKVWRIIAFIAILLTALGLYGLVKLNVSGRTREFSIRKVLGARLKDISVSVFDEYAVLVTVALVLGAPLSYYLVRFFFDSVYTYHVPMNLPAVVIAVSVLVSVLLTVVFSQVRKVIRSNPVDGLKVE